MVTAGDGTIGQQLAELKNALKEILEKCAQITRSITDASTESKESIKDIQVPMTKEKEKKKEIDLN
jgi:homoserine dehydrogenase